MTRMAGQSIPTGQGVAWRLALALFLAVGLLGSWLTAAPTARAADDLIFTVTSAADPTGAGGTCTLRGAVEAANSQAGTSNCPAATGPAGGGTVIAFALGSGAQTITLSSTLPYVTQPLTFRGPGAALLTIRRDAAATPAPFRLIDSSQDLAVSGLTFTGGDSGDGYGGVFYTSGIATVTDSIFSNNRSDNYAAVFFSSRGAMVTNSTFTDNSAVYGGAFFAYGFATVTDSTFTNNTASGYGGGFYTDGLATLTDSTFTDNSATGYGGGFYTETAATVSGTTFTNNRANLDGGGFYAGTTAIPVTNSTFASNRATNGGGGFFAVGNATVTRSTFAENSADYGGGFNAGAVGSTTSSANVADSTFTRNTTVVGGGGFNSRGTATVAGSTFATNSGPNNFGNGGGAFNADVSATVVNSIFTNGPTGGFNCTVAGGKPTDNGGNVSSDDSCINGGTRSQVADPRLLDLSSNGGPTQTHALLDDSPARGIGIDTDCQARNTDQRGIARPATACDSGAYQIPSIAIAPTALFGGTVGTYYAQTLNATGGTAPYTFTALPGTLPGGLSISSVGLLNGTPTAAGSFTFTITATDQFDNSGSQALTLTIDKATQTIDFATPPDNPSYTVGQTFTVGATATSGLAVTFTADPAGVCTISGTTVTATGAGTCTVRANQAGNTNYLPASEYARTFGIARVAQTIDFGTPADNPSYTVGQQFTIGATATSGLTVTFALAGPCSLSGTTVTTTGAGTCTVTAGQAGNATYAPAPDVVRTFPIDKQVQTITFGTPTGSPSYTIGQQFTVGATASSGLTVTFAASGACTIAGTTVTPTGAGDCTITASQPGDATYAAATDVPRIFAIDKRSQTITFATPAGNPSYSVGQTFPVDATATSGLPVGFAVTGSCSLSGTTVTTTGVGTCTVTASQAGDATYAAATPVARNFAVGKVAQAITFGTPTGSPGYAVGQTFTVGATSSSGLTVSFAASGVCTIAGTTVTTTGAGVCTVTASQAGDATYAAASDVVRTFAVAIPQSVVRASAQGGGTVSPAGDTAYPTGGLATYTATPGAGQLFLGWTLDNTNVGFASPLTFAVGADRTLVARFAPRPAFSDVTPSGVQWDAITQLAARGIINGYGDGTYGPADPVQRAQIAALIVRALGWAAERPTGPAPFSDLGDVDPELQRAIIILTARGIAKGYDDGTYNPTGEVTHAQAISLIARSMVQAGYWQQVTAAEDDGAIYPNIPAASPHRLDLLTYVKYAGGIPDRPTNQAWPDWEGSSSRGWTAQVLWLAYRSALGVDRVP